MIDTTRSKKLGAKVRRIFYNTKLFIRFLNS